MNSINTNIAAMTALQSLNQTNKQLLETQSRISTGLAVATAADNAAYFSIATTMKSDNAALGTVQDALGLGAATVDVAYTALDSTIKVVDEIKTKLVAAREPGVDRVAIQAEISELQNQLSSIASSASFNGENFLSVNSGAADYNASKTVVASFTRSGANVSIGTISIDITATTLFDAATAGSGILDTTYTTTSSATFTVATLDISTLTDAAADLTDLEDMIQSVDTAFGLITTGASNLGAASKRIELQSEFIGNLMDAIDRGVSQLVDADMNEESTKLQALQVQQQLGIQALSIANSGSQNILSLFR